MRKVETEFGTKYYFNNKFVINRTTKNERILNYVLKSKFKLIKSLKLDKFCKKNWFETLDWHYESLSEANTKENGNEKIVLNQDDLILDTLVMYDILPKEYIGEFKHNYIKLRNKFIEADIYNKRLQDVNKVFFSVDTNRVLNASYLVDHFTISKNNSWGKYFKKLILEIIMISESFYIVKYTLSINEYGNALLNEIVQGNIFKDISIISCDKWWKKKSIFSYVDYKYNNEAKKIVLENYILELKYIFFKQLWKSNKSLFFNWEIIPPSLEVYKVKDYIKRTDIVKILNIRRTTCDNKIDESIIFSAATQNHFGFKDLNDSKIIIDSNYYTSDNRDFYHDNWMKFLSNVFAVYYIIEAIDKNVADKINNAQKEINKSIAKKSKINSLINIKYCVEKELYYYRRFYKEIAEQLIQFKENEIINDYSKEFKNMALKSNNVKIGTLNFTFFYKHQLDVVAKRNNLIENIYQHFNENSKIIDARYNYRIVKWTFIVGIISILTTILVANNYSIMTEIIELIKNIFQ